MDLVAKLFTLEAELSKLRIENAQLRARIAELEQEEDQ